MAVKRIKISLLKPGIKNVVKNQSYTYCFSFNNHYNCKFCQTFYCFWCYDYVAKANNGAVGLNSF